MTLFENEMMKMSEIEGLREDGEDTQFAEYQLKLIKQFDDKFDGLIMELMDNDTNGSWDEIGVEFTTEQLERIETYFFDSLLEAIENSEGENKEFYIDVFKRAIKTV